MEIAYYITDHGRGHAARALRILRALSPRAGVHLRTGVPRDFFSQRFDRPFSWAPVIADTGPLHRSTGAVDLAATVPRFEEIERSNANRFDAETAFLRETGIDVVVCDIPPWPLEVAAAAGIPGVVTVNFTWVEILAPAGRVDARAAALVARLRRAYAHATLALQTPPALEMPYFPRSVQVPLITSRGRQRRDEIARRIGVDASRPWAYLYFGEFGIDWVSAESIGALKPWILLTRHRAAMPVPGLITIPDDFGPHEDITASVDVVVAKPGYGIITECMGNGTPLVTTGRDDFAEYAALEPMMQEWGGAIILPPEMMLAAQWRAAMVEASAFELRPDPSDGARTCARLIEEQAGGTAG